MDQVKTQDTWGKSDRRGYEMEDLTGEKAAERSLVRKLDLHIVPVIMLLYLFSFLDR